MADVPSPFFGQVTVLAPGLLGASVLMAAKERGLTGRTAAWARREEVRHQCAAQPWCDAVFATAQEAVADADIVVLCPPVDHVSHLLQVIAPHLKPGAVVTDVGSTKAGICARAAEITLPQGCAFIGAHPMAGSEKTGLEHGSADLFAGRTCFVIEPEGDAPAFYGERLSAVRSFWEALGMRILTTTAKEHDQLVAETSHLPHLLASALSAWLGRDDLAPLRRCAAGQGLRDTTRIAAGDPQLWLSIVRENRFEITRALQDFLEDSEALLAALKHNDDTAITRLLQNGKAARDLLDKPAGDSQCR